MTVTPEVQAYFDQPATDRFEMRLPKLLKQHAEEVARAQGESLSELASRLLAAHVAEKIVETQQWHLTPSEQMTLLRVLTTPPMITPSWKAAVERSRELFGE